jgi:hypothetical protein
MTTLEDLICKSDCRELIIKMNAALDTQDEALFDSVMTEDARRFYGNEKEGTLLRGFMRKLPAGFFPTHLLNNIMITPTGPDTAEGSCYGTAYNILGRADDALPRPMPATPSRVGKSSFKFRKTADGWRIAATIGKAAFLDDMKMPHREGEFADKS